MRIFIKVTVLPQSLKRGISHFIKGLSGVLPFDHQFGQNRSLFFFTLIHLNF